ncbi:MAG: SH3 domain-containing protein [Bifidobacteriaceae bacterium]|jgi:uncharacterized protein YgiM (DUF1202 family)|nr:SH3 domain-containing protein [Bifidobacteriaceae bacterium]
MWAKKGKLAKWKGQTALKLRTKASVKARKVAKVKKGKKVRVLARKGAWVKVSTASGVTGWTKLAHAASVG